MIDTEITKYAFILVNYNGWKDTLACLDSLSKIDYKFFHVIVFDNNSNNESVFEIENYANQNLFYRSNFAGIFFDSDSKSGLHNCFVESKQNLTLIKSNKNLGFAAACNRSIELLIHNTDVNYFILLNNDTVVSENILSEFDNFIKVGKKIGLLSASIGYYEKKEQVWFSGGRFHWYFEGVHKKKVEYDVMESDFITGCLMVIPKSTVLEVGLLSEHYFLYSEDTDYSMRVRKNGLKNFVLNKVLVLHKIGQSTGGDFSPITYYYGNRNRLLLHYIHYPMYDFLVFFFVFMLTRIVRFVQFSVTNKFWLTKVMCSGIWSFIKMDKKDIRYSKKWPSFSFIFKK